MSTRAELVTLINSTITTNGRQAITGANLNEILIDFTNSFLVPGTDYPLSPANGGTGVANSNSNTITLGGDISTGGNLTTTGTFSSGGNFSTSSTFSVTGALSIGAAFTTSAAVTITPAFTVSGSNAVILTTTGTGTTTVTFQAGTYTAAGLSLSQVFTGANTFQGNIICNTGTVDMQNGLTVSSGTTTVGSMTAGNITMTDARNIILNVGTGTKIGTDAAQKLGFWNATPVVKQTTAIGAAAFVANSSSISDDTATYGGYTMGQVIAVLKLIGLLT